MAKKPANEKAEDKRSESEKEKPKRCLMITPIGPEDSDIRRATNGLFWEVIVPVCKKRGYKADVSHEMSEPGSIMDQVVGRLITDDLVIADLTNNNPNVAYELAIRHAARKLVICLIHAASKLPFDLQGERVIVYRSDMMGVRELKKALAAMILAVERAKGVVDNPVVRGAKTFKLTTEEVPQTVVEAIMRRFDEIEQRVSPNPTPNKRASYGSVHFKVDGPREYLNVFFSDVEAVYPETRVRRTIIRQSLGTNTEAAKVYLAGSESKAEVRSFLAGLALKTGVSVEMGDVSKYFR